MWRYQLFYKVQIFCGWIFFDIPICVALFTIKTYVLIDFKWLCRSETAIKEVRKCLFWFR